MAGLFGNYGPTSAGGVVGINAAAQQAPQQVTVQQLPMQPLPGIMGQTSPGYAALSNMGYGYRSGGLVGALLGAGYGAQTGGFIDPQMAQMQLMGRAMNSLPSNMPDAEKIAILQNPQLQIQYFGGELKAGADGTLYKVNPFTNEFTKLGAMMPKAEKLGIGESAYVQTTDQNGQPSSKTVATSAMPMPDVNYLGAQSNAGDNSVYSTNRGPAGTALNMAIRNAAIEQNKAAGITPQQQAQVPQQYAAQKKAIENFEGGGPLGNTTRSFSVALDHAHVFKDLAQAMGNGDYPAVNAIRNEWRQQMGSDLPTNLNAVKQILSAEIAKAVQGGDVAEQDRANLQDALSASNSWQQLSGVIDKVYSPLLSGQMNGLQRQYVQSTGKSAVSFRKMLSDKANEVMGPPPVRNETEYGELKSGQQYIAPDGSIRTKK